MGAADDLLWQFAGEQEAVPTEGFGDVPQWVRAWIFTWLRQRATACPHIIPTLLAPVVVRAVGNPIAFCPACAVAVLDILNRCAHCGVGLAETSNPLAFSIAGGALIVGCWCPLCWNGETR